jgi:hypothetical protein
MKLKNQIHFFNTLIASSVLLITMIIAYSIMRKNIIDNLYKTILNDTIKTSLAIQKKTEIYFSSLQILSLIAGSKNDIKKFLIH